ncbi:MAG: nicotinate-nucleotide diphosphorylase, partial [Rhizomicrobium sp.]
MTPAAPEFARPPAAMLIEPQIRAALEEDLGRAGDITSDLTIPADQKAEARLVARRPGRIAGLIAAEIAFRLIDPSLAFDIAAPDGSAVESGSLLATVRGPARAILTGERVALNFAGHLSGVATATA